MNQDTFFSRSSKNPKVRSFRNRTLTIQEFYKAAEQVKYAEWRQALLSIPKNPGIQSHTEQDIVIHTGDLHIEGDFGLWNSGIRILIIEGNLTATGYLELLNAGDRFFGEEWSGSFYYYPGSPEPSVDRRVSSYATDCYVIVTGDVKARVISLGNHVEIQGDATAEKLMSGAGIVWGNVKAPVLFVSHGGFAVEGNVTCDWGMGVYYSLNDTSYKLPPPDQRMLFDRFGGQAFEKLPVWELLSQKERQKIQETNQIHTYYAVDQQKLWACLIRDL